MISPTQNGTIGLLVSGGLDSSILLAQLLKQGRRVQPIYVRCDLYWQPAELAALERFLLAVASPRLEKLVTFHLPLADVYDRHWSITGKAVPGADTPDEAVYLPGRNALLIIKAALWCQLNGISELALAPLGSNPFPDATAEFFREFSAVLNRATNGDLQIARPFAELHKQQVMELGRGYPLELTFSCIAPVDGLHCGVCNKCAERQTAFRQAGMEDPTRYARTGSK
jgi:7-cyano-7-deazaguanine synthase